MVWAHKFNSMPQVYINFKLPTSCVNIFIANKLNLSINNKDNDDDNKDLWSELESI